MNKREKKRDIQREKMIKGRETGDKPKNERKT